MTMLVLPAAAHNDRGSGPPDKTGLDRAEQDVRERVAELLAREPGEQHSRHLVGPGQQHRRAGVDHDHGVRVRLRDAADELVLATGQRERAAVEALANLLSNDPFFGVRIAASEALRGVDTPESREILAKSLIQRDARVRLQVVKDYLAAYQPGQIGQKLEVLRKETNPAIQADGIRALAKYDDPEVHELLIESLTRPDCLSSLSRSRVPMVRKALPKPLASRSAPSISRKIIKVWAKPGSFVAAIASINCDLVILAMRAPFDSVVDIRKSDHRIQLFRGGCSMTSSP
jgi:HEAT repeat protein